ncbi:hypothetical protein CDAR_598051 [Caerostris darwini]|uniref:Uncharacterized protein n=1 Tax=Caerostris darwini TaxID=1538125 RepID=A0AAV4NX64_9ARAC|nr:hypothetical protein CDAR_598051 [Caerostris darwini]
MQTDYALRRVWTRYLAKNTKNMSCLFKRHSTPTVASECRAVELETTRGDRGRSTPACKDSSLESHISRVGRKREMASDKVERLSERQPPQMHHGTANCRGVAGQVYLDSV